MIDIPADALSNPSGVANLNSKTGSLTMNALVASYTRLTTLLEGAWYAIPLRLMVGYGFMEHGTQSWLAAPNHS